MLYRDAATCLLADIPEILRRWEQRVRSSVHASQEQQGDVLLNNLRSSLPQWPRPFPGPSCRSEEPIIESWRRNTAACARSQAHEMRWGSVFRNPVWGGGDRGSHSAAPLAFSALGPVNAPCSRNAMSGGCDVHRRQWRHVIRFRRKVVSNFVCMSSRISARLHPAELKRMGRNCHGRHPLPPGTWRDGRGMHETANSALPNRVSHGDALRPPSAPNSNVDRFSCGRYTSLTGRGAD